jgi:molecular chaperone HscB
MSVCWECNRFVEKHPGVCAGVCSCGAIQPLPVKQTYFDLFELPVGYDVDVAELERRFRDLSRTFHPDKFTKSDVQQKRISLQRITAVNDGYRVLKHPVRRAEYLLGLRGLHVGAEDGSGPKPPASFLMEMLEQREALSDSRAAHDADRIARLATEVSDQRKAAMAEVAAGFAAERIDDVALALVRLRYYDRFLEEVATYEDQT